MCRSLVLSSREDERELLGLRWVFFDIVFMKSEVQERSRRQKEKRRTEAKELDAVGVFG